MRPHLRPDSTEPVDPMRRVLSTLRAFSRDERGEIDALDLALLGLMMGVLAIVLGGPAEALAAAARLVHLFVGWIS